MLGNKLESNDGIQRVTPLSPRENADVVIRASEAGLAKGSSCWWCGSRKLKWYGKARGVIECLECGSMTGEGEKNGVVRKYNKRMDTIRIGEEAISRAHEGRGWYAPTARQMECLRALAKQDVLNMRKCAVEMGTSLSSVRKFVRTLEDKGLLNRVHNCPAQGAFEISETGRLAMRDINAKGVM